MNSKKRILISFLVIIGVFISGVIGFKLFGGKEWSLLDSLYMTVITLSTVGYEEVIDTSANPGARLFASLFIILCLGTIAFAISSITAFIVEGELKNILWRRKMDKQISRLKDHIIVCGSDETAETIIQELLLTHRTFVVVEPSQEKIDVLISSLGHFLFVTGDPAEDNVLRSVQIEKAKGIILSLPKDEENLFVTITARNLNPKIRIVAKGIEVKNHPKMKKAGADSVISPDYIGGRRMVSETVRPTVVSFLDMMLHDRDKTLRFEEIPLTKDSPLVGKTVKQSQIREKTGALLVALKNQDTGEYKFNPSPETEIKARDVLVFIATPEMLKAVHKKLLKEHQKTS